MGYLTTARQWRPNKFDDLVGQEHVVQTIKNAIRMNRRSHAYLFSGSRGVGKTSVARIFAKTLRCPNADPLDATPCNSCSECLAISESRSVDVIEIDGASNNGVEAIRGIRESVAYGASSGTYKIFIIDEVHMLSISAFNALLKTLEEPPSHVIFIFATTEAQKIPLTILSRCQHFEFRRLTHAQIISRLQQVLSSEKYSLTEEALQTIASHSDGSLRDALSLMDQILSYFGEPGTVDCPPLNEKDICTALGISGLDSTRQFLMSIINSDLIGLIKLIENIFISGVDLKHFSELCLGEIRLLYLVSLSKAENLDLNADSLDISTGHFSELLSIANKIPVVRLERMAQIMGKTIQHLGWSTHPRFVLEMAAIRMSKLKSLEEIEKIESPILAPKTNQPVEESKEYARQTTSDSASCEPIHHNNHSSVTWKGFVDSVMKKRPLLGALLAHANFKMESDSPNNTIKLAFPVGSFYEKQATDLKNRSEIEEFIHAYFGESARLEISNDLHITDTSLEESRLIEISAAKKQALEHPAVLQIKEIFGADLVDIKVDQ